MRRLIDANALLERLDYSSESWAKSLKAIRNWWPHAVGIKDNIVAVIKDMPTVDAVEVVRCKDCKHYELHYYVGCNKMENGCSNNKGIWTQTQPEDFCSYGERKDNA